MNKNSILLGIIGLVVGLFIGFYAANSINRRTIMQQDSAVVSPDAPFVNQQVQNVSVKPSAQSGMMPEVTETLDKAKNEPGNYEAQMKAGDMYSKIQKFDKAVEFYEIANRIKPDDYQTVVKIGNTYFDAQKFEDAQKWYEQALAKNPDDVNVRTDLGITFVERENPDLDRAIKEFQTSLQKNPRHEPTLYNLGIAFYKKGKLDEAGKVLNELQTVNPQSQLAERLKQMLSAS